MKSLSLVVVPLLLANCGLSNEQNISIRENENIRQVVDHRVNVTRQSEIRSASEELARRVLVYEEARRKAKEVGLFSGAIRGTLLGAMLGGESGALAGFLLGASLGAIASDYAADELIKEHQNYLISRSTIDAVIAAAKNDTNNLEADVAVVRRLSNAISPDETEITAGRQSVPISPAVQANLLKLAEVAQERTENLTQVTAMMRISGSQSQTLERQLEYQEDLNRDLSTLIDELALRR